MGDRLFVIGTPASLDFAGTMSCGNVSYLSRKVPIYNDENGAPKKKMTLDMFLDNLYKHYGIIIGPNEYKISLEKSSNDMSDVLANSFAENLLAFQAFLKSTGFLKELSDATSIVINPYTEIK